MQNNRPLDKGRAVVVAEKYDSNGEQKNRYATIGRATLWPMKDGSNSPNIELDIDTMPVSSIGPVKVYIFWDSESKQDQGYQNSQQQHSQQAPQHGYQQHQGGYGQQGGYGGS